MRSILGILTLLLVLPLSASAQEEKKETNEQEKTKESPEKHGHRWRHDKQEGTPRLTLLTGTYDPRGSQFGALRQYTLASGGLFADYLKGNGPVKAEVFGVGFSGGRLLGRSQKAEVSPFLGWGWGVYHSRQGSSETKLAWRLSMGVETKVGFIAKLQLLDTKLQQGELRGSSLMFGWRF